MEPKIDLDDYIKFDDDDHMGGYKLTDTITLSSLNYSNTVIGGGYSYSASGTNFPNVSITPGSNTSPYTTTTANPWSTYTGAPTIQLDGEGADIKVNGWSLIDAIKKIEERLNILHPNTKLEAEWEDLKILGEQYRKLEQHIKDKQATWNRLKVMPPPVID